jgi:Ankyrin repeats (many copies)
LSPGSEHLVQLAAFSMPFSEDLEPPPLSIFTQEATTRLTATLVSSIRASDLAFIHSLLFSPSIPASSPSDLYPMSVPVLVNLPDSRGWSPIHHCVSIEEPSLDTLDALYCAGADVSLFTLHEQQTALHILAHYACTSKTNPDRTQSLREFTLHLIYDLRAPLAARDKNDETCIHIAAEHGNSVDLLYVLLACDTTGAIRQFKNSRGYVFLFYSSLVKIFTHKFPA